MGKNYSQKFQLPHRRKNILTGEWVLVSPQRTNRPWQGETTIPPSDTRPVYDPHCYLCPGNRRANGDVNPKYDSTFAFTNDFSSLLSENSPFSENIEGLLQTSSERGICRVINFSPRHDLTLAEMTEPDIDNVIAVWQNEFDSLGKEKFIRYVQIFENKGSMMGNSNPHPHCQIWAQEHIPMEPAKEQKECKRYFKDHGRTILQDYVKLEIKLEQRIVYRNEAFVVLVPFWAVWPFETMIVPLQKRKTILELTSKERKLFANAIKVLTVKYDNLFKTSFPYSSGIHQAPTDGSDHSEWQFHMHFYPPLLRSAQIKKFMVGYEMLAEPQRDITPETSAEMLRKIANVHYKGTNNSR